MTSLVKTLVRQARKKEMAYIYDKVWTVVKKVYSRQEVIVRGETEEKEEKVFNRFIRVSSSGWEYEADHRHAEIIIKKHGACTKGETNERHIEGRAVDSDRSRRIQSLSGYDILSGV